MTGRNVEHNSRFNQVIMRIRSPRTTAMITERGHLTCYGACSFEDAHRAARRFARIIQKMGFPVSFSNFKINNVTTVFQSFRVRLNRLSEALRGHCSYEPERFTGLYFHFENVRICVFHTGKMIFTGSSDLSMYTRAFWRLYPALCNARR
ncbi:uncharacterized protein LOC129407401 [Boleophthalmus pectinirostris]|uniref:uncharacterized protein LOC129407401 n=1 Tax=Boleophthalmus pectinirostris TaxID=150288 RepID=UPI00242E5877|nr:uncharacterized protein LOC129407401 [Boleophthalmus pectinirostris]